ncbi:ATP synthase subunit I [Evansella cellulosilytica]|uniref:ATP synthase I n=1 Tax=Evansella cellulosilytica (strain ATCC 21833 / DSM 2522 / FERM P-1141 / JCM 9156 / N-4) TaxID=649639 RepID=E6TXB0_EVAC2|nr:ATP synthase subunit I [Evansella cellulosilytica]ADU32305.1 ATP synthase I [Evansella cellulosilytica DSM 2522]
MMDYKVAAKRYTIFTIVIIAVFLILAFILSNSPLFLGIVFGASFSLINLINTYLQVKRIGEVFDGKKRPSLVIFGTLTRIIAAVLAVTIAMRFPEYLQIEGVIIGLAITYFIILIEPMFHIKHLNR